MIRKFRKKPAIIEAIHFGTNNDDGTCMKEIENWILSYNGRVKNDNTNLFIDTLEGVHRADVGDWIIKGIKNEFYLCKDEIFKATYEEMAGDCIGGTVKYISNRTQILDPTKEM